MSCCCNNSYSGLPCCCPANYSVTTTTTCPFGICCDPSCNNGEICDEVYSSDCVIYSGPEIVSDCFTIQSGMDLTEILQNIISTLPICTPTTTTTTTTICQYPSELINLNFNFALDCEGTVTNFTSSEQAACEAMNNYLNVCAEGSQLFGQTGGVLSFNVGQTVYDLAFGSCYISDGYYLVDPLFGSNFSVVHIVDSIIDSITTC